MTAVLKPSLPVTRSNPLDGPGVPRFERDVQVLLNDQRTVAVEEEISDQHAGRETNENLNNVVVVGPI